MYKKLQIQMTIFCTAVTSAILIALTIACLLISESGIKASHYSTFSNAVTTTSSYLEKQTKVTYEWLTKMQEGSETIIHIEDSGIPLLFSTIYHTEKDKEILNKLLETLQASNITASSSSYTVVTEMSEIQFKMHNNIYYTSIIYIPKNTGSLTVYIIKKPDLQNHSIFRQRMIFAMIDFIALLFLFVFSFFFTKRLIQPLKESHQQQTQFIASASHELRTPLTVILSSIQAMGKASGNEAKKFSDIIASEGKRMSRLLSDMLSLASTDNQSFHVNLSEEEPDTLLLNSYESFEEIAKAKQISLHISLPDDPMNNIFCDKIRLKQVLSILIDNGISYTPKGGKIILAVKHEPDFTVFSISDNGIGISAEDKKHIFDRFYRSEKSHTQKEHFGLGLCIAKEIIKLHHGELWVMDTPGGGATFFFTIPS